MTNKMAIVLSTTVLLLLGNTGFEVLGDQSTPRIGIILRDSMQFDSDTIRGLRDGIEELGYTEKKDIFIETSSAEGNRGALKSAANELVGRKVNLIFTMGSAATMAAMAATKEIPIVFRHPLDPLALGLVKNLEQPGANVTGVAGFSVQQADTRLGIFKEIVPTLRRVLIFYNLYNPISRSHFAIAEVAATNLGLHVSALPVKNDIELKDSLNQYRRKRGDALYHVSDVLVQSQADYIFKIARQKKLPTMFGRSAWAARGSLAGYGPNYFEMGRQAATLVDQILKGAKPGDLPIGRAKKFDLHINLRTASIIGITVPREVLRQADKVIR